MENATRWWLVTFRYSTDALTVQEKYVTFTVGERSSRANADLAIASLKEDHVVWELVEEFDMELDCEADSITEEDAKVLSKYL